MKSVFALPGKVTVKGKEFLIPAPTPTDLARVRERMRELALAGCTEPLKYVDAQIADLKPITAELAVRGALAVGTGGGVEPHPDAVSRQYESLEGVRFRLWYYARKANPALTQDEVKALVTEDDSYDVADALFAALGLGDDGPKTKPAGEN